MECFQDINPVFCDTAFVCCQTIQTIQTAMEPAVPSGNVLPESLFCDPLLIKPASTFCQAMQAYC